MQHMNVEEAIARARQLAAEANDRGRRLVLGLTGPPGAGKSTLAGLLVDALDDSVLVGMDGFHLAHSTLTRLGIVDRKGAIHTFDAEGYVNILSRIHENRDETVWVPEFRRDIEDAIAGAIEVSPHHRVVITEGNYLLSDQAPWDRVRDVCDEVWYVDVQPDVRLARLVLRHRQFGRSEAEAMERAAGSDELNAQLIEGGRDRADALVDLTPPVDASGQAVSSGLRGTGATRA